MSRPSIAGAISLVVAAPLVIVGTLVSPTISDEAADQVSALTAHRSAMIVGQTLSSIALVLLLGGTIWLALMVAPRSPKLALTGVILGVLGDLVVLFEGGIRSTFASVVGSADATSATTVVDRIGSSAAASGLEPLSLLGDIGLLLLGIAAVRVGLPRWAAASLALGALVEGVGFATSTKAVVVIGFALVFVGAVTAARTVASTAATTEIARPFERVAI